MAYLKTTKWRPPQWWPLFPFSSRKGWGSTKGEAKYSLLSMGNLCLDLTKSPPSPHTHTLPCPILTTPVLPCTPLSDLHSMSFVVYFNTLYFTFCFLFLFLQIHYVYVQCCTSHFYPSHSGFSPSPKILIMLIWCITRSRSQTPHKSSSHCWGPMTSIQRLWGMNSWHTLYVTCS